VDLLLFPTGTSPVTYTLLKMNPESSEIETLQEIVLPGNRTVVSSFNIAGGWIFFHTDSFDEDYETLREALYRVSTDGSGFEMVLEAQYLLRNTIEPELYYPFSINIC